MNKNNQIIALLTDALSNVATESKEAAIQNIASVIRLVNENTPTVITTPKVTKAKSNKRRGTQVGSQRLSVEQVKTVNERLSKGVAIRAIAEELGSQYHTIYRYETKRREALAKSSAN